MSDESFNAPSEHSDDSFDIFPDDATDHLVHVTTSNGMDRVVEKLLEVLSGTTKVLSQNQAMLSNIAQIAEAVSKDKGQNEERLAALPKVNDARDRRMAEPTDDLGRKYAAIESLEKAIEDARYEIHLPKFGEQEANRRIAEMSKKIKELEELQVASSREISDLLLIPVYGQTVSMLASNGCYLCANYDNAPATVNGIGSNWDSVRFTVENAGNGQIALKACGKYLTVMKDGSTVNCCSSRNKWSQFDWIVHHSGEISLRSANGKYISSENGFNYGELVTCNREKAGPLERFTVV